MQSNLTRDNNDKCVEKTDGVEAHMVPGMKSVHKDRNAPKCQTADSLCSISLPHILTGRASNTEHVCRDVNVNLILAFILEGDGFYYYYNYIGMMTKLKRHLNIFLKII